MGSHAEAIDIESAWRKHINLPDDHGLRPDEAKGNLYCLFLVIRLNYTSASYSFL